ncbi:MAG: DUF86 domain-containing protein [Chloroflexota bacterium]
MQDILDAIAKIEAYISEANYEEFLENTMLIDSVNMNLMIIGEATKNLSTEFQNQYTDVDWRNIAGLRNIITHEYFRLNLKLIWDVIENELPKLKEQVKEILEDVDNG